MAQDVVALLDYVGWKEDRKVHVVGLSLGGMIAQGANYCRNEYKLLRRRSEVAFLIPERIASLTLGVTTPGGHVWNNLPPVSIIGLVEFMCPQSESSVVDRIAIATQVCHGFRYSSTGLLIDHRVGRPSLPTLH